MMPAHRRPVLSNVFDKVCVDSFLWKTRQMRRGCLNTVFLVMVLGLVACAGRPELLSRSPGNPAGVDLSGAWQLRDETGAPLARAGEQEQTIRMPKRSSSQRPQQERRSSRSAGSAVQIFIETGKLLKVSQTVDGLFISFDRAVVEEFTFGENRIVSVGPIEAQRVAGWEGRSFVVETMDKQGTLLTESWTLGENGSVLVRVIIMADGDKEMFSTQQVFDRV